MKRFLLRGGPALVLFAAAALVASGCGQDNKGGHAKGGGTDQPIDKKDPGKTEGAGDHSGWWCNEHGLPEEVCDLCQRKFREAEKAKGNWCEHNRVKTSCFKCNPGLKEKYAAEYKAKYGKEPPPTEDEEKEQKNKK